MDNHNKKYTEEEIEFIQEMAATKSIKVIAKSLGRTPKAIAAIMEKRNLGTVKTLRGEMTASELASYINVDSHIVYRWIKEEGLPSTKKNAKHKIRWNFVNPEEFWKWAYKNKEKINFSKIQKGYVLPEPDWLIEEIKKDSEVPPKKLKKWTDDDCKLLLQQYKYKSAKEIGQMLGRSEGAINRKISKLKREGKIPKKKINIRWTDEEIEILIKMTKENYPDEDIAYELGREREHVVDKRRRVQGMENKSKYYWSNKENKILEMLEGGSTRKEISNYFGVSQATICRKVKMIENKRA